MLPGFSQCPGAIKIEDIINLLMNSAIVLGTYISTNAMEEGEKQSPQRLENSQIHSYW